MLNEKRKNKRRGKEEEQKPTQKTPVFCHGP